MRDRGFARCAGEFFWKGRPVASRLSRSCLPGKELLGQTADEEPEEGAPNANHLGHNEYPEADTDDETGRSQSDRLGDDLAGTATQSAAYYKAQKQGEGVRTKSAKVRAHPAAAASRGTKIDQFSTEKFADGIGYQQNAQSDAHGNRVQYQPISDACVSVRIQQVHVLSDCQKNNGRNKTKQYLRIHRNPLDPLEFDTPYDGAGGKSAQADTGTSARTEGAATTQARASISFSLITSSRSQRLALSG